MKRLINQARSANRRPCRIDVRRAVQRELSLAVVAQAPRLQHAGKPDVSDCLYQLLLAVDRGMRRHRNFELGKQGFFDHPILRRCERRSRRPDSRDYFQRLECAAGNIFPVEGHNIAARRQFFEQLLVRKIADQDGRNLGARRIGAAIEKQALHAQGVPGKGEHAPQLPGTHDSNAQ